MAFEVGYGMSYYGFDACGDRWLGALFRKAVLEKFRSCPFTDAAVRKFEDWRADTDRKVEADLAAYLVEHGAFPERLDGMKMSCADAKRVPPYVELRDLLERYSRGEVSFDLIVRDKCDVQGGTP
jgi:hypothetical protein